MSQRPTSYSYQDLLDCASGKLFGENNARLPSPPMLMFDRVTKLSTEGGKFNRGQIFAELDIHPKLWFFECHFATDPVMPGCLGLDALWQLVGFYLGWLGHPGAGRALGAGAVKFRGQVLPTAQLVTYQVDVKRVIARGNAMCFADAMMKVDGNVIYECEGLQVGVFNKEGLQALSGERTKDAAGSAGAEKTTGGIAT